MFSTRETDPMLRRFERNQVVATLAMAAAAAVVGRFGVAVAIIGGGALMAMSYRAIKGGIDAMMPATTGGQTALRRGRRRLLLVAKFVGRYALLALAAYVMLVCLSAHPVGLLVGATSPVVAVAIEAVRVARAWSRPGQSR
jgi:hypothetical protein